jgi:hypothetical protein
MKALAGLVSLLPMAMTYSLQPADRRRVRGAGKARPRGPDSLTDLKDLDPQVLANGSAHPSRQRRTGLWQQLTRDMLVVARDKSSTSHNTRPGAGRPGGDHCDPPDSSSLVTSPGRRRDQGTMHALRAGH